MKTPKATISLILSFIMLLSLLTACQDSAVSSVEPSSSVASSQNSTPASSQEPVVKSEASVQTEKSNTAAAVLTAEKDAELRTDMQTRIDEILSNDTEIVHSDTYIPGKTYTGTAYYVSNDGDDNNDGLTPETAWATIDKVNNINLHYGDCVFFERNGLWRGQIKAQDGVVYTAYGTGEKPRIYASPENGADPAKWSLLEDTENIWVYYKDIRDCGALVFNNDESFAVKVAPKYKNGYLSTVNQEQAFDVRAELTEDLMFFCDADDFKINGMPMHHETIFDPDSDVEGPLYLRCDEGNPGEVFDSIEFMVCKMIIDPAQESVFHNLCLKYTGFHAIAGDGGYDVSFCEIGWIGGSPFSYEEDGTPVCGGNAVEAGSNFDHFSVTDCYIYQCYDTGISHQWNGESVLMQNITYARNVITHTDAAVEVFFTDRMSRMENILIEDNYFMYSGYGWYKGILGKETPWGAAYQGHAYPNMAENFRIENNVLYLSSGPLINTAAAKEHQPVLDGNTYIQTEGNILACWMTGNGYGHPKTFICESSNMQEVVTDILGDKNGIVFVLPENTAS